MKTENSFKIGLRILVVVALLLSLAFLTASRAYAGEKRGWLGVGIEEMTPSALKKMKVEGKSGLIVIFVEEKSPADKAGIKEDDVIISFNDKKVKYAKEFSRTVKRTKPGTAVNVKVVRDSKVKDLKVKLGEREEKSHKSFSFGGNFIYISDRPQIGIKIQELNKDLAAYFNIDKGKGVLILEVFEDTPAEKSGLKAGDVITSVDKEKVSDPDDLLELLEDYDGGDEVTLEFVRKGKTETAKVELEERDHHKEVKIIKKKPFMKKKIVIDNDDCIYFDKDFEDIDIDIDIDIPDVDLDKIMDKFHDDVDVIRENLYDDSESESRVIYYSI